MGKGLPVDPKIAKVVDSKVDAAAKELKDIRVFGYSMIIVPGLISLLVMWLKPGYWLEYALPVGAIIAIPAILYPPCMKPVYKAWMFLASIFGFVMGKVVFSIFFFTAIFPMGMIMKIIGRDQLHLKGFDSEESNWTKIEDSANDPKHFEHQF